MWSKAKRGNSSAEKCAEIKEKSGLSNRKGRILWSCYPDLNRRPHPYQQRQGIFYNIFVYLWSFLFQRKSFPALSKCRSSVVSTAVCGWLCGQRHSPNTLTAGKSRRFSCGELHRCLQREAQTVTTQDQAYYSYIGLTPQPRQKSEHRQEAK